jgi:hypothetical protein
MDNGAQVNAERDALHDQFRQLLAVLTFAAGYNSDGLPQLRDPEGTYQTTDDEDTRYQKLTRSAILNTLATVCVRSHEAFSIARMTATDVLVTMELEKGSIPPMDRVLSLEDSHHDDEKVPSIAKHCGLVVKGHPLEVDVTVEDDEWWKLCIEKQG